MRILRWVAGCSCLLLWQVAAFARAQATPAQEPRRVALFKAAAAHKDLTRLAEALDPQLHAELGHLGAQLVVSQPALDLPSLQLALDCVGETPSCLASVAERTQSDLIIAPSIIHTDQSVTLSLLLYDPARASPIRVVTRRFANNVTEDVMLTGVPSLMRELFGLSAPEQPSAAANGKPAPARSQSASAAAVAAPSKPGPSLLLPIALGSAGAVFLGAGIAYGVAAKNAQDSYAHMQISTPADAERAAKRYQSAQNNARMSNVALGVGAATLAAGAIVFTLQHLGGKEPEPPPKPGVRVSVGLGKVSLSSTWN